MAGTAWVRDLVEFFLPAACAGCGARIPPERRDERICVRCRSRLRRLPPPLCGRCGLPQGTGRAGVRGCEECRDWPTVLRAARSAVVLEPPADRLVHGLKYGGWRELAQPMAHRIAALRLPAAGAGSYAAVIPVPTTRSRRRRRGYNQAAMLGRAVSETLGRPYLPVLRRRGGGRTQVSLQPLERGSNVRRAFSIRQDGAVSRLRNRSVLLVDDVLTTGATAAAAARTLGRAGVADVTVVTFARSLPFRSGSGR